MSMTNTILPDNLEGLRLRSKTGARFTVVPRSWTIPADEDDRKSKPLRVAMRDEYGARRYRLRFEDGTLAKREWTRDELQEAGVEEDMERPL